MLPPMRANWDLAHVAVILDPYILKLALVSAADFVYDEFISREIVKIWRATSGMQSSLLFFVKIDGKLHGLAKANGCGCLTPPVRNDERDHLGGITAAVAQRQ